ncbi:MAG: AMP-binding protein [Rhodocyclaceae bacterium]|nr:AMP-binding protein [Rhodocyclaceae bacterium]
MDAAAQLLALVTQLRDETHAARLQPVTLDSRLEGELGFDSLARAELLMRVERDFGCRLATELLATVETPRDLLDAVLRAQERPAAPALAAPSGAAAASPDRDEGAAAPASAATLVDVLEWHAAHQPERIHIVTLGSAGDGAISYGALWRRAHAVAAGLQARGFAPNEAAAIMLPTCAEFFPSFFGVLLAGGVPVPIYPPARPSQLEDHLRRHAAILANAGASVLITFAAAALPARLLRGQADCVREIVIAAELVADERLPQRVAVRPEQLAFLQYTSGSTGNPKGVMLTHANLLANIRAMGAVAGVSGRDSFVSWLPLYHDMGLISAWLSSLTFGMRFAVMSPLDFLAAPERWLWAIHHQRGTLSGAPNFAYELCVKRIADEQLAGLDLSSWRIAFNGAEPVNADTMARFAARFSRWGLRPQALAPAYGLAECSVALSLTVNRGLLVDRVRRRDFSAGGAALPAPDDEPDALRFVACGRPLPGHGIRIVDAAGKELPERREGRLQFRGPSATAGYYRNAAATRALLVAGDWRDSGDYAYLADGEVFPTGRAKDIIIKGGRNFYPQELEEAVGKIPGIRQGNVAVFASADPASGSERIVVAAETKAADKAMQERLRAAIHEQALAVLGVPADDVVVSHRHIVLKTSSGKLRRAASRELYEKGGAAAPRAVWLQVLRLALAGVAPGARRLWHAARGLAYGAWAWLVFAALVGPAWLAVVLMPRPALAWAAARGAARLALAATGVRLAVTGREHLAGSGPRVLAANHASYLDGLVLVAALPYRQWRFVAKRELMDQFFARHFLAALGCQFVERFELRQGVTDAQRIGASIAAGHAPVFFVEGTFTRVPGLRPFRMGAFVVAAQSGVPVLPVALRGTRDLMRDGTWMPRHGAIALDIGAPIAPSGSDWAAAVRLRDATRAEILRHCGEADLGG